MPSFQMRYMIPIRRARACPSPSSSAAKSCVEEPLHLAPVGLPRRVHRPVDGATVLVLRRAAVTAAEAGDRGAAAEGLVDPRRQLPWCRRVAGRGRRPRAGRTRSPPAPRCTPRPARSPSRRRAAGRRRPTSRTAEAQHGARSGPRRSRERRRQADSRTGSTCPSGAMKKPSSNRITPLQRRHHPCSEWSLTTCAVQQHRSSTDGQDGVCAHIVVYLPRSCRPPPSGATHTTMTRRRDQSPEISATLLLEPGPVQTGGAQPDAARRVRVGSGLRSPGRRSAPSPRSRRRSARHRGRRPPG